MQAPELTDGVVRLRIMDDGDAEPLVDNEDDELIKWLTGGPGTIDGARAHIRSCANAWLIGSGKLAWGLRDAASDELAGTAEIQPNPVYLEFGAANLSYGVFPQWRGRGYSACAIELMCEWLRAESQIKTAVIKVSPDNEHSLRIARQAGFTEKGTLTEGSGEKLLRFNRSLR